MDSETSRLRRGAIRLGDVEEETLVSSKSPARKPWIKIALYSLAICASIIGLGSLLRAIIVIDNYDWADNAWPFFHHVFVDQYRPVIGLLLMSIFWAQLNLLSLRKQRETLPGVFSSIYDILMIIALIYFPTICCSWLYDKWWTVACEYVQHRDIECLPVYSKILHVEIAGLVCAYLMALVHLLLIAVRVITFIVDLHGNGRFRPLGRWLYQRGYSTEIAIYFISGILSIIGFGMMMWVYASLLCFADRQGLGTKIWGAHFRAGFGVLTFLLLTVPIWFLANLISLCCSRRALSATGANIYDFCVSTGLIYISMRCFNKLDRLYQACGESGHCAWLFTGLKPRHVAAIVLGVIVGTIHLALFLSHLSAYIRSTRAKNRILVTVVLRELDTSTWSEDRVAALRYALQDAEPALETGDGETDTDAEGDDEGDEVQLQEIWPALTRFGNLLERVKRVLLGPKTASRGEDEEESAALLCGDSRDSVETEGAEDAVLTGDLSLNLEAVVVTGGTVGDCAEPLVLRSEDVDKPLPPPPLAGDGNPADI